MRQHGNLRKTLSLLVAICMIAGLIPLYGWAGLANPTEADVVIAQAEAPYALRFPDIVKLQDLSLIHILAGSFGKPVDGGGEDCYLYDPKTDAEGWVTVRVENPKHGFGIRCRFKKETLPYLIEWRSCHSTDYALGIEPSNSRIMGRKAERENGTLKKIAPFEKVSHTVIFGVYDL